MNSITRLELNKFTFLCDNTVLSNFASVQEIDLLCQILSNVKNAYTTNLVLDEFNRRFFEISIPCLKVKRVQSQIVQNLQRIEPYRRLGQGELSLFVLADSPETTVIIFTDDRMARKLFEKEGFQVHGTVYLLILAVCFEIIPTKIAFQILEDMIDRGYYFKFKGEQDDLLKKIEDICGEK